MQICHFILGLSSLVLFNVIFNLFHPMSKLTDRPAYLPGQLRQALWAKEQNISVENSAYYLVTHEQQKRNKDTWSLCNQTAWESHYQKLFPVFMKATIGHIFYLIQDYPLRVIIAGSANYRHSHECPNLAPPHVRQRDLINQLL